MSDTIEMIGGLPGFTSCRRFLLLTAPEIAPFARLQGLDAPQPSFLAMPPRAIAGSYRQELGAPDLAKLGAAADEPLLWLSIVRIDGETAYANLRAPIVINPRRMVGLQVLSADEHERIDHPLRLD